MISAVLYQGRDGLDACRITGHSGQAESGRDIVCAAVSILGCTCVNAMETAAQTMSLPASACPLCPVIRHAVSPSFPWYSVAEIITP